MVRKASGEAVTTEEPKTRTRVVYDDDEWTKLALLVLPMRINEPMTGLGTLVEKAMQQMPEGRRRKLVSQESMQPLIERMREEFRSMRDDAAKYPSVHSQLQAALKPTDMAKPVEIELDDEQVKRRFGKRVLNALTISEITDEFPPHELLASYETSEIVGEAAKRLVADLLEHPVISEMRYMEKQEVILLDPAKERKMKIGIVGGMTTAKPDIRKAVGSLCDLFFTDVTDKKPPANCDLYIVWRTHCSHALAAETQRQAPLGGFMFHASGVEKLIEKIQHRVEAWHNGPRGKKK